jgi:ribose 1,5-bisphosphokinase
MSGVFVAVVGPSGAGKDSLIAYARDKLGGENDVVFVRRVVTREADRESEDHDSLDPAAFAQAEQDGAFALNWDAHGLRYGLPIGLEDDLQAGRVVVANVSRGVIPDLMQRYPTAIIVSVRADREVIAERLAKRGRETMDSIRGRLDRSVPGDKLPPSTVVIDNSGALAEAGEQFLNLLRDAVRL